MGDTKSSDTCGDLSSVSSIGILYFPLTLLSFVQCGTLLANSTNPTP